MALELSWSVLAPYALILVSSLAAGFVNAFAGGGTFSSYPAFVTDGVSPALASASVDYFQVMDESDQYHLSTAFSGRYSAKVDIRPYSIYWPVWSPNQPQLKRRTHLQAKKLALT